MKIKQLEDTLEGLKKKAAVKQENEKKLKDVQDQILKNKQVIQNESEKVKMIRKKVKELQKKNKEKKEKRDREAKERELVIMDEIEDLRRKLKNVNEEWKDEEDNLKQNEDLVQKVRKEFIEQQLERYAYGFFTFSLSSYANLNEKKCYLLFIYLLQ